MLQKIRAKLYLIPHQRATKKIWTFQQTRKVREGGRSLRRSNHGKQRLQLKAETGDAGRLQDIQWARPVFRVIMLKTMIVLEEEVEDAAVVEVVDTKVIKTEEDFVEEEAIGDEDVVEDFRGLVTGVCDWS